jgi:hypothetical protein
MNMDIVCTMAQILFIVLLAALFVAGLAPVISAVRDFDSSPGQIARRTSAEIEQIASEGKGAMDDLSEHYLSEVYDEATRTTTR